MNKNTTDITLSAYFNDIVIGYYEDEDLVKQFGRQLGFDVDMDTFMAVSFQYPSDMNVKPEDREKLTDAANAIIALSDINKKIGGKQSLKCVGKNPRLAQAKSRNDKNISGLLNQIEDNAKTGKIGIHTFTNASAHEIGQTKVKLISIQFASSEENHMQFFAQVVVDVAADPVERSAEASGLW